MIHPTVQTASVENVFTIGQPPDLFSDLEVVQTYGATLRRVAAANRLPELHHRQDFTDQNRRYRRVFRHLRLRFGPRNVGFQEIGETQKVKERENEFLDETQSDTGIAPSPSPTVKQ